MLEENALMIKTAFSVANKIHARCVVLHVDPLEDLQFTERVAKKAKLILVSRKKKLEDEAVEIDRNERLIASLADEIGRIERAALLGETTNEKNYEDLINRHNDLIVVYNELLKDAQEMYAKYEMGITDVNAKVDRYNRLAGRR